MKVSLASSVNCPSCRAPVKFEDVSLLSAFAVGAAINKLETEGADIRCGTCGSTWHQTPVREKPKPSFFETTLGGALIVFGPAVMVIIVVLVVAAIYG